MPPEAVCPEGIWVLETVSGGLSMVETMAGLPSLRNSTTESTEKMNIFAVVLEPMRWRGFGPSAQVSSAGVITPAALVKSVR